MSAIRIEVLGVPVPQGSMKAWVTKEGKPVITSANKGLRAWRDLVAKAASDAMLARGDYLGPYPRPPMDCAVGIDLQVFLPRPKSAPKRKRLRHQKRPDLDKLIRAVLDALTGVVFRDDSQVCAISAQKDYDYDHAPGIICVVYPIPDADRPRGKLSEMVGLVQHGPPSDAARDEHASPPSDRPAAPPSSPEIPIPAAGPPEGA